MSGAKIVVIDGSALEGGGQVLRVSLALSAVLEKPVRVCDIRGKRPKPGLGYQHAAALRLVSSLSPSSIVEGNAVGSKEIYFDPCGGGGSPRTRSSVIEEDVGSAGSCTLVLQAALPSLLCGGIARSSATAWSAIVLKGGTDVPFSPPWTWTERVFLPLLERFAGIQCIETSSKEYDFRLVRRGYAPEGGGEIILSHFAREAMRQGTRWHPIRIETQGKIARVNAVVFGTPSVGLSNFEQEVRRRFDEVIRKDDSSAFSFFASDATVECEFDFDDTTSTPTNTKEKTNKNTRRRRPGGVVVTFETDTGCVLGSSRLISLSNVQDVKKAVRYAVDDLESDYRAGACVDRHAQDQLIVFMALATTEEGGEYGRSSTIVTTKPTLHTITAISVAERFTGCRFEIVNEIEGDREEGAWRISCFPNS